MLVGAKTALKMYSPTVETKTVISPLEREVLDLVKGPRVIVSTTVPPLTFLVAFTHCVQSHFILFRCFTQLNLVTIQKRRNGLRRNKCCNPFVLLPTMREFHLERARKTSAQVLFKNIAQSEQIQLSFISSEHLEQKGPHRW